MHRRLLEILIDPVTKTPLRLADGSPEIDECILEGSLQSDDARSFPIRHGIPRLLSERDEKQGQTESSFGFKWQQRDTYDSAAFHDLLINWNVERYGFQSVEEMKTHFGSQPMILDAGCGSGMTASLWLDSLIGQWVGSDISEAIDVAQERLGNVKGTHFVQADILNMPFLTETFDMVIAEGVLHHTPSTEKALKSLAPLLKRGGEYVFYVYRKKGPVREFTDDHIREAISGLAPDEAWDTLRPLTKLAKALTDLHAEVEVPEDIPFLGIKAGRCDVQRLLYWNFAKLYWNDELTFEENNHVNFDWYHPAYAHRQDEEEVREWMDEAGLTPIHFHVQESGFSVRATRD